jgi:cytochrome P450
MESSAGASQVVRSYPFGPVDRLEIDPMYGWLREHEPLSKVNLPYGDDAWLLVRYDDVRTALADPRFSLAEAVVRDVPRQHPQRAGAILTDLDPPEHTRLRRLVANAFAARRVEQLRGKAEQVAAGLVPYADRDEFRDWVAAFMSTTALTAEQRGERLGRKTGMAVRGPVALPVAW